MYDSLDIQTAALHQHIKRCAKLLINLALIIYIIGLSTFKLNRQSTKDKPQMETCSYLSYLLGQDKDLCGTEEYTLSTLLSVDARDYQICPGLKSNEIQIPYDKHHKVSSLVKSHQNKQNSVKYEVT